jgi:hypothetical protein
METTVATIRTKGSNSFALFRTGGVMTFLRFSSGHFRNAKSNRIIRDFGVGARKNRVLLATTAPGVELKSP